MYNMALIQKATGGIGIVLLLFVVFLFNFIQSPPIMSTLSEAAAIRCVQSI